jgi:uncharacterized protein YfdQ (DUF2303 family)
MGIQDLNDIDDSVAKIAQLGSDATKLEIIDMTPPAEAKGLVPFKFSFNHGTGEKESLKQLAEEWRIAPERKRGIAKVSTLGSFILLTERHKTEHSTIFAATSWPSPTLTTVIDYHEKDAGNPAFGQHRIHYAFPVTEEFRAWMDADNKPMTQEAFAAFIENRIAEIGDAADEDAQYSALFQTGFATPADMMMLSRGLEVNVKSAVKAQHRLASGEAQIVFTEEHDTKITVPGLFMVSVPAFLDADPVRLPARLRYRVNNGSVMWFYQLYRWKELLRAAILLDLEKVFEETQLPIFEGIPES